MSKLNFNKTHGGMKRRKTISLSVCKDCALRKYCEDKNSLQTKQAIECMIQLFREKGNVSCRDRTFFAEDGLDTAEKSFSWNCLHLEKNKKCVTI